MDNTPNMADLFGRMADMQQKMADTQEELAEERVSAEVGGGMVSVTADGRGRILGVKLDAAGLHLDAAGMKPEDIELLEDLLIAGVNKALDEAENLRTQKMREAATSFLPPGMDLGGLMGGDSGSLI
ncbi:MAG: YbaB/EbfC family nucleoid-associated protein [Bacteroidetes bacterium]|nr:YbaB/EbfC family nucleoid-associated protein [Bacteroidota bacterium]